MQPAGPRGDRPYGEPAATGPPRSGRDLARPRSRGEAVAYLVALGALYVGLVSLFVVDMVRPACTEPDCQSTHPGLGWPLALAALGFVALVVLARRLTRGRDRERHPDRQGRSRRGSPRGWPLAWNYLAAGLVLPDALRLLRRVRPP